MEDNKKTEGAAPDTKSPDTHFSILYAKVEALEAADTEMKGRLDISSEATLLNFELLNAKVEALEATVAALKEQLASAPAATSVNIEVTPKAKKTPVCPEFKLGAKTYMFKMPAFILGETRYVAEEITNDKALLEKIAREYPGIIQEK